tara:strand:+ start:114 stop:302 length:189 start_codon:yes stop_codon:yes gene_type:complete
VLCSATKVLVSLYQPFGNLSIVAEVEFTVLISPLSKSNHAPVCELEKCANLTKPLKFIFLTK